MSDWENDMDDEGKEETAKKEDTKKKSTFDDENEDIQKTEEKQVGTIKPKDKPTDYEEKYNKRHQDDIKRNEEIKKSIANIKDDEARAKKEKELQNLHMAEKLLGVDKKAKKNDFDEEKAVLNVEKDFVDLAQKIAIKINQANKIPHYTLAFLKNCMELLGPSLSSKQLDDLIKTSNIIFNKKIKEEGGKKPKNKKPTIKSGKIDERDAKNGLLNAYRGDDNDDNEFEEDDDDDFM